MTGRTLGAPRHPCVRVRSAARRLARTWWSAGAICEAIRYLTSVLPVTQNLDFEVNDRARALADSIVERVFIAADDHFDIA